MDHNKKDYKKTFLLKKLQYRARLESVSGCFINFFKDINNHYYELFIKNIERRCNMSHKKIKHKKKELTIKLALSIMIIPFLVLYSDQRTINTNNYHISVNITLQ